jgi:hypothetical protein
MNYPYFLSMVLERFQYGKVSQRLKPPLMMQSPPTRTNNNRISLAEERCLLTVFAGRSSKSVCCLSEFL